MGPVSHQTIRLARGRHRSPAEGACVMELAALLSGEPFNDHPACVCPVIGSFLRGYNDLLDDERRQDLYAYASEVVDSRGSLAVEQARIAHLAAWGLERHRRRWTRFLIPEQARALAHLDHLGLVVAHVLRIARRPDDRTHRAVLALLDELLALREPTVPQPSTGKQVPRVAALC